MIEFLKHIEFYESYQWAGFSRLVPEPNWGNKDLAEEYLNKYWLSKQEYKSFWKPIQDKIFISKNGFPDLIFNSEYELLALRGGCLFLQEDYEQLQKVLLKIGETEFVIIQSTQDFTEGEPMFKMKFPVNTSWEELISGNYISAVILEMSYNEYFVFGASGMWGKYSANDYKYPLDIIGFKSEFEAVFKHQLKQQKEEQDEILEWLPLEYKELIK